MLVKNIKKYGKLAITWLDTRNKKKNNKNEKWELKNIKVQYETGVAKLDAANLKGETVIITFDQPS